MRGSALRRPVVTDPPCAPRGLGRAIQPRPPRPRGALPLVGSPASNLFGFDTPDRKGRPFGIRVHGALLPETPAQKGPRPFLHHPLSRREPLP